MCSFKIRKKKGIPTFHEMQISNMPKRKLFIENFQVVSNFNTDAPPKRYIPQDKILYDPLLVYRNLLVMSKLSVRKSPRFVAYFLKLSFLNSFTWKFWFAWVKLTLSIKNILFFETAKLYPFNSNVKIIWNLPHWIHNLFPEIISIWEVI